MFEPRAGMCDQAVSGLIPVYSRIEVYSGRTKIDKSFPLYISDFVPDFTFFFSFAPSAKNKF